MPKKLIGQKLRWFQAGQREGARQERIYLFNLLRKLGYFKYDILHRLLDDITIYEGGLKEKPPPE